MAAYPGSLDYLYHNGILDCIPYEAYQIPNVGYNPAASINTINYLNLAKQGALYENTYTNSDSFKRVDPNYGTENKSFKETILEAANSTKDKVSTLPSIVKGFAGTGIIMLTLITLLKRKRFACGGSPIIKPIPWAKLNPVKWFKK